MTTPFPFSAGAVLQAQQLNSITELVTNTQTNDYTLAATDAGDRVIANKATAIVFTVPNSVFTASQIVRIHNIGAGTLTLSAGAGLTLNGADVLTVAQYQGGELFFTSASSAIFFPTAKTVSAGGLDLISSTTIGALVNSVTVSSAFSATYDAYKIIISGGSTNNNNDNLNLQLGSTTTGYFAGAAGTTYSTTSSALLTENNASSWQVGFAQTESLNVNIELVNPFLAKNTYIHGSLISSLNARGKHGVLINTTSYTAFTLIAVTGQMSGGTIRVYGYKN